MPTRFERAAGTRAGRVEPSITSRRMALLRHRTVAVAVVEPRTGRVLAGGSRDGRILTVPRLADLDGEGADEGIVLHARRWRGRVGVRNDAVTPDECPEALVRTRTLATAANSSRPSSGRSRYGPHDIRPGETAGRLGVSTPTDGTNVLPTPESERREGRRWSIRGARRGRGDATDAGRSCRESRDYTETSRSIRRGRGAGRPRGRARSPGCLTVVALPTRSRPYGRYRRPPRHARILATGTPCRATGSDIRTTGPPVPRTTQPHPSGFAPSWSSAAKPRGQDTNAGRAFLRDAAPIVSSTKQSEPRLKNRCGDSNSAERSKRN